MTANHPLSRAPLALALLLIGSACGPTRYFIAPPDFGSAGSAPCVLRATEIERRPGELTQHRCAAWTSRDDFDVIETIAAFFPDLDLGVTDRSQRACPGCWLTVERLSAKSELHPHGWRLALHLPPEGETVAEYRGGFDGRHLAGEGQLTLTRTPACTRYCLDFFVVDGALASQLTLSGAWSNSTLVDPERFTLDATLDDGATFVGEARYDRARGLVPHGRGLLQSANGDRYEGEFFDGQRDGTGEALSPDGTRYTGAFVAGSPEGEGAMVLPDGISLEGTFQRGRPHGTVTRTLPDGTVFTGTFVNGMPEGAGELQLPSGLHVTGQWVADALDEADVGLRWPDGSTYRGPVAGLRPEGQGVYVDGDTGRYQGAFARGRPHGFGELRTTSELRVVGSFLQGHLHGCAVIVDGTQAPLVATFTQGKLVGAGCASPDALLAESTASVGASDVHPRDVLRAAVQRDRTTASRAARDAQLAALASQLTVTAPAAPPVVNPDDAPVETQLGLSWPPSHQQRIVRPSCVHRGQLKLTIDGAPAPATAGGLLDASVAFWLTAQQTAEVCVQLDGACGPAAGCTTVEADPDPQRDAPLARVLLAPSAPAPAADEPETPAPTE